MTLRPRVAPRQGSMVVDVVVEVDEVLELDDVDAIRCRMNTSMRP